MNDSSLFNSTHMFLLKPQSTKKNHLTCRMSLYKYDWEKEKKEDDGCSDRCTMTQVKTAHGHSSLLACFFFFFYHWEAFVSLWLKAFSLFTRLEHCAVDCEWRVFVGDVLFFFFFLKRFSFYYITTSTIVV